MSKSLSAGDLYKWLQSEKNPLAPALETVRDSSKERKDILYVTALAYAIEIDDEIVIRATEDEIRKELIEAIARGQDTAPTTAAGVSAASRLPVYLAFKAGRLHDASGLLEFDELVDLMGQMCEQGEPISFIWRTDLHQIESKLSQDEGFDLWALTPDQRVPADDDPISEKIVLNYLCLAAFLDERRASAAEMSL